MTDDIVSIDPVVDDVISDDADSDVVRDINLGEEVGNELLAIADKVSALDNSSPAMEAYQMYASSLINRLNLPCTVSSESNTPHALAEKCTIIANSIAVSLEGYEQVARFIFPFRSQLGKLKDVEKRLQLAKRDLGMKIERLANETNKLSHKGLYWFLMRNGESVTEPLGALKESLDGVVEIYELVSVQHEKILREAINGIKKCGEDKDVEPFFETISNLDNPTVLVYEYLQSNGNLALMGNRHLVFEEKSTNSRIRNMLDPKTIKSWTMGGNIKLIKDEVPEAKGTYVLVNEEGEEYLDLEAGVSNLLHKAAAPLTSRAEISASMLKQMVDVASKAVSDSRKCFEVSDKANKLQLEWKAAYNEAIEHEAFNKESKALFKNINRMCDISGSFMENVMSVSIKQMIYMLGGTAALIDVSVSKVR